MLKEKPSQQKRDFLPNYFSFAKNKFIATILLLILFSAIVLSAEGFILSSPIIKATVEKGGKINNEIGIINSKETQTFKVTHFPEDNFISIEEKEFIIEKNKDAVFNVLLDSKDKGPGVYVGEISVSSSTEETKIPVIMEVETAFPLFDVSLEIPPSSVKIIPGGALDVEITVHKLKGTDKRAFLELSIKDLRNNELFSESQELNVERQTKIEKSISLPQEAEGEYVFSAVVKDVTAVSVGTGSLLFSTSPSLPPPESAKDNRALFFSFIIIIILIVAFLTFNHFWNKRIKTNAKHWREKLKTETKELEKKLSSVKKIKFSDVNKEIGKLQYQKSLLENAMQKNYITEKSYSDGTKKINELIKKLKKRL